MKKFGIALLSFVLCFIMVGCNSSHENSDLANDVKKLEEDAIAEVKKTEEVSEDKVKEAIDYIQKNITTPAEDMSEDTVKKIAYYSTYLEELGKKDVKIGEHDIVKFGKQSHEYIQEVYSHYGEKLSVAKKSLQEETKKLSDALGKEKDSLVNEFKKLF